MKIQNKWFIRLAVTILIGLVGSTVSYGMKKPRTEEVGLFDFITQFPDIQSAIAQKFKQLQINDAIRFLAWRPVTLTDNAASVAIDNKVVVAGLEDGTVKIWNLTTGQQLLAQQKHPTKVLSVAISGNLIASGSYDGTVHIWRTDGTLLRTIRFNAPINSVALSKNILVFGFGNNAYMFAINENKIKQLHILEGHEFPIDVAIDGNTVVTVSPEDGALKIWNATTGELLHEINSDNTISSIAIRGSTVAFVEREAENLEVWDMQTGNNLYTLTIPNPTSVAIHGNLLISTATDHTMTIRDIHSGKIIQTVNLNDWVTSLAISSNLMVAKSLDDKAKLWLLNPFQGTPDTNTLLWIIYNATTPQADLINRAYEATVANQEFIIAFPSEDAKIFLSFPKHVQRYLVSKLKIRR